MNRSIIRAGLRALVLTGAIGLSVTLADARERSHHTGPTASDFYAYAGEHPAEAHPAPAHSGNCFVTNSAVEAARGIRHWSGNC